MAWKQLLNGLGVASAVLAVLWQLQRYYAGQAPSVPPVDGKQMNAGKLLADLRNPATQHAALTSAYTLAGSSADYALQLAQKGLHKELLQLSLSAGLEDVKNEVLPIALMTLGRMVHAVDGVSQDLFLKSDNKAFVDKAVQIIRTGVPGWIAALAQLAHALCRVDEAACTTMQKKVLRGQEDVLVPTAVSLLEMGGVGKHQDVLTSGCKLAELLVQSSKKGRQQLLDRNIIRLLVQVITDDRQGSVSTKPTPKPRASRRLMRFRRRSRAPPPPPAPPA